MLAHAQASPGVLYTNCPEIKAKTIQLNFRTMWGYLEDVASTTKHIRYTLAAFQGPCRSQDHVSRVKYSNWLIHHDLEPMFLKVFSPPGRMKKQNLGEHVTAFSVPFLPEKTSVYALGGIYPSPKELPPAV
jgi:hypothetical protein